MLNFLIFILGISLLVGSVDSSFANSTNFNQIVDDSGISKQAAVEHRLADVGVIISRNRF